MWGKKGGAGKWYEHKPAPNQNQNKGLKMANETVAQDELRGAMKVLGECLSSLHSEGAKRYTRKALLGMVDEPDDYKYWTDLLFIYLSYDRIGLGDKAAEIDDAATGVPKLGTTQRTAKIYSFKDARLLA
jgi:hypothetical protein